MAIKRTKWDAVFSDLVRYRDKWTCQKCGRKYAEKSRGLHCSHFYGRRAYSTRFEPRNAMSLCFSCHLYVGSNPVKHIELWESRFSKEDQDFVHCLHNQLIKKNEIETEEHYKQLKERLNAEKDSFRIKG